MVDFLKTNFCEFIFKGWNYRRGDNVFTLKELTLKRIYEIGLRAPAAFVRVDHIIVTPERVKTLNFW